MIYFLCYKFHLLLLFFECLCYRCVYSLGREIIYQGLNDYNFI